MAKKNTQFNCMLNNKLIFRKYGVKINDFYKNPISQIKNEFLQY